MNTSVMELLRSEILNALEHLPRLRVNWAVDYNLPRPAVHPTPSTGGPRGAVPAEDCAGAGDPPPPAQRAQPRERRAPVRRGGRRAVDVSRGIRYIAEFSSCVAV